MQARSLAQIAMEASECALAQATQLKVEQERTSQQVTDILTSQADDTQKSIQSATKVAVQTQQEVQTLSALAKTADLTVKMTAEKVECQVEMVQ